MEPDFVGVFSYHALKSFFVLQRVLHDGFDAEQGLLVHDVLGREVLVPNKVRKLFLIEILENPPDVWFDLLEALLILPNLIVQFLTHVLAVTMPS